MTPSDAAKVLAKISAYDQRTVGAADIAAWHEILAPYPLGEALQAVTRHHRDSTERCRPAHLVAHIKAIRAEQAKSTSEPLALPGKLENDPARDTRIARGVAQCRDTIADLAERWSIRRGLDEGELSPSEQVRRRALKRAAAERRVGRFGPRDTPAA